MRDTSRLAELFIETREAAHPERQSKDTIQSVSNWMKSSLIPISEVEIAEFDGDVVGFSARLSGQLKHLYVHPSFQRRGFGTTMLDSVKKAFPAGFYLWIDSNSEDSKQFVEKRGCTYVRESDEAETKNQGHQSLYHWRPS